MQVVRHFHGQKYVTAENASILNRGDAYDSIQFCVCLIPRNAPHFFMSPTAIPVNRCLTEWISSVKPRLLPDKLLILNNLSVKSSLLTDKLSI